MKKLYIDFDGVILDTIKSTYKLMDQSGIDKYNLKEARVFYRTLDWRKTLENTPEIHHSIDKIKKLMESKLFDVSVLTHIVSYDEGVAKIDYLRQRIPELPVVLVPKEFSKAEVVNPKDAILVDDYTVNLKEWKNKDGIGIKFSEKVKENEFPVITDLDELAGFLDISI